MSEFTVLLGIDRACRDTQQRLRVRVMAEDKIDAAIKAEAVGNSGVEDPLTMYTHAMEVVPVSQYAAPAMAMAA